MRFDVVTLFPEMFPGYLGQSLLNKAIEEGLVEVGLHNLRDWAKGKQKQVDDRPFGGGPGMVLMPEPVVECVEQIRTEHGPDKKAQEGNPQDSNAHVVLLSPQGRTLRQSVVEELASHQRLILLCGRYEGFDQRVIDILQPDEISIGDYIINGGEVAAMVLIDALIRLTPGVLGDEQSAKQDSFSLNQKGNRPLEFAQYTRPRVFRGIEVPDVLVSGNHPEIARWRQRDSLEKTRNRRSDLLPPDDAEQQNDPEQA